MTRVRVDLNISLDGFATTTDQTPENPFGEDWGRLTAAYTATRTFHERVFLDTSGAGTTGVDEKYAAHYFENIGAEIMGAGMFGLHANPDDPDWRGWWGEEPPFHAPVFVLTHTPRPSIEFANGTSFHFLRPRRTRRCARRWLLRMDATCASEAGRPRCGSICVPVSSTSCTSASPPSSSGAGSRLWDDLRGFESGYRVTSEVAESGVTHITFSREG